MKRFSLLIMLIVLGLLHGQVSYDILCDSEGAGGDQFGYSVAMRGDFAAVGANGDNSSIGSVLVYQYDGNQWNEFYRITASDGEEGDQFGSSVVMDEEFIIVGAYNASDGLGAVYFYEREDVEWLEVNKFVPFDTLSIKNLGNSLALCDSMVIAGASRDDFNGDNSGAVYSYKRIGNSWEEAGIITASDGESGDYFGRSVDLTKNGSEYKAIIGAPLNQTTGAAYVYALNGELWHEQVKIMGDVDEYHQYFGGAVQIDGNKAAISTAIFGMPDNEVHTYTCNIFGWEEQDVITRNGSSPSFGGHLVIQDDYLIISDTHGSTVYGGFGGEFLIYKLFDDQWGFLADIHAYNGDAGNAFGSSICLDGTNIIVGAYGEDGLGVRTGLAYIYDVSDYIYITGIDENEIEPAQLTLQNYPNPFNPLTTIEYNLNSSENVKLTIFNAKGQLVEVLVNEMKQKGDYSVIWNADKYSSGIYFYQLITSTKSSMKKMVLLK